MLLGLSLLLLGASVSHAAPPTSKRSKTRVLTKTRSLPQAASILLRNRPPTVRFTSPTGEVTWPAGVPLELQVEAHDPDGDETILRVDFFANGARVCRAETPPYPCTWTPPAVTLKGDANLDGRRSTLDITLMRRHILGIAPLSAQGFTNAAAMGGSAAQLTTLDITVLRRCILGLAPCDDTTYALTATVTDAGQLTGTTPQAVTVTVQADTTPPTGTISINTGAVYTTTPTVTLTLTATDHFGVVSQMQLSDDNLTYTPAEPYATTKSWTLPSGDGPKTVYVKFSDPRGNWSQPTEVSILLDTTTPTLTITHPPDGWLFGADATGTTTGR